jgi:hypothetical protein
MMSGFRFAAATALVVTLGMFAYHPSARAAELTEGQARNVFVDSGCSNIGALSRDSNGMWRAMCQKTPVPAEMAINSDGKVVPAPANTGVTRGTAHSALVSAGCSNMSALAQDANGAWHATCQGTPFPTQMMVSADGKVGKDPGYTGMSESRARSILTDAGCSTISSLGSSGAGGWSGMCWKGGQPVQASVSADGKPAFH